MRCSSIFTPLRPLAPRSQFAFGVLFFVVFLGAWSAAIGVPIGILMGACKLF
jgi:hypothetical protein